MIAARLRGSIYLVGVEDNKDLALSQRANIKVQSLKLKT